MRFLFSIRLFLLYAILLSITTHTYGQQAPLETAMKVANKVMYESSFSYYPYEQGRSGYPLTVDIRGKSDKEDAAFYAFTCLKSDEEKETLIGVSSGAPVKLWIDNELVYSNYEPGNADFDEIAYGVYTFSDTFKVYLTENVEHTLLIKIINRGKPLLHMGAIHEDGFVDWSVSFELENILDERPGERWFYCGPFITAIENDPFQHSFSPESEFNYSYKQDGDFYSWKFPEKYVLLDAEIPDNASYRGGPYTDWTYSNGATMWSILRLAEASGDKKYLNFVKQFCEFTLDDYAIFKHQYYDLNAYKGHNYRIWRMHMLDDASAPALPYIFLYDKGELEDAWFLIEKAAKYAAEEQFRLDDQTLCRPEPSRWTIWADDLFMYVPFILKYAEITGNEDLVKDAVHQAKMFYNYLFDDGKGLYYHGWFSVSNSYSVANWSRANGWVTWAMSELLMHLPENTKDYKELQKMHKEHLDGLLEYQHESGLWHQVLDHPETFLETSGTAMFTIALARGVNKGWLGDKYRQAAIKAWQGIETVIEPDGTVNGICQGTGIGEDIDFYRNRNTRPHDPRGIGAVITAGIEMEGVIE